MIKLYWPINPDEAFINPGNLFGARPQAYVQFGLKGHDGLDFVGNFGVRIYASHDGDLTYHTSVGGLGQYAMIKGDGFTTYYGHMSAFVGVNRKVRAGDLIGKVGSTGYSTGNHLHLSLRPDNYDINNGYRGCIDPTPYLANEREKPMTNQTKVVLGKDGKTVWICTPVSKMEVLNERAGVEGFEVPASIPPASTL